MKTLTYLFGGLSLFFLVLSCNDTSNSKGATQLDPVIEKRVDSLLSLMNLQEKVGQMTQYNGNWDVTGPHPKKEGIAK